LDIVFGSTRLKRLCHDDKLATRTRGALSAQKLRARLDDLTAAANLSYALKLPGHFHRLSKERTGQFALELHGGCRLVVVPVKRPVPKRTGGTLDLSKVTIISVVYVGDYHD
jgi:proteic killer suppression protein